jgi:ligand-binding sensor domain-containing protein
MVLKRSLHIIVLIFLVQTELFPQQYFFRGYSVEQGLPQSSVYCLLQDSRGFIWMGTDGGGVTRFDGQSFETFTRTNGLSDNVVRSLFEDNKGNIWIGTDNGLTIYDGFGFKIIGKEHGLKGTSVLKIIQAGNGIIWAATNDAGLARISTAGDSLSVISYSTDDGLVSNFIFDLYEDHEKNIWLAMVGGVNILEFEDTASFKIKKIYKPEVNSKSVVTMLSIEPAPDGSVWFGSYGNGLFKAASSADKNKIVIEPSPVNTQIPDMTVWDLFINGNGELWMATNDNGVVRLSKGRLAGVFNKDNGLQSNQIVDLLRDAQGNIWFASFGQGL